MARNLERSGDRKTNLRIHLLIWFKSSLVRPAEEFHFHFPQKQIIDRPSCNSQETFTRFQTITAYTRISPLLRFLSRCWKEETLSRSLTRFYTSFHMLTMYSEFLNHLNARMFTCFSVMEAQYFSQPHQTSLVIFEHVHRRVRTSWYMCKHV